MGNKKFDLIKTNNNLTEDIKSLQELYIKNIFEFKNKLLILLPDVEEK